MNGKVFLLQVMVALLSVVLLVFGAQAGIENVTVAVDGMSCPFCAFGVEKRLKGVVGVQAVAVDMRGGTATLTAEQNHSIAVTEIPGAIKKTGFTAGNRNVTALGKIEIDGQGRIFLTSANGTRVLFLFDFKKNTEAQLRSAAKASKAVKVSGAVHLHEDAIPTLSPERVEEVAQ